MTECQICEHPLWSRHAATCPAQGRVTHEDCCPPAKFVVGDRVRMRHSGTVTDRHAMFGSWTYNVTFDDVPFSRIPPQTAIGVREDEMEMAE